jgi:S-disulfanyl-L-cysteine oxidoreductase SoxD
MADRLTRRHYGAAALVAAALCTGCDWPWRHDMADQPSPPAAAGPRSPVSGSRPVGSEGPLDRRLSESIVNPLPGGQSDIATGRALYAMYCVPCHGPSGSGVNASVAKYFPRVGDLTSSELQQHGDGWLYATITTGTDLMPAYGHELDPQERWSVVEFVRTLAR